MTTAKTSAERSSLLSVNQLRVASWNARKTFDQASLAELAESIRQHGVLVKLIVRPLDVMADVMANPAAAANSASAFEIVAGHRRFRAAQLASVKELPCEIRELTDDQAREIGLVDNLQRENVPAMEEAVAFSELLMRLGSIEAVASRVQKDQGYVAKRLKLCSVTLAVQDSLRHCMITIDHALVLARLGADEQDAALKWCIDRQAGAKTSVDQVIEQHLKRRMEDEKDAGEKDDYRWRHTWEPQSVQELKDHIASESGVVLDRAPWDLESADLVPDVGACSTCPQNTKANAPLFGDLEIGEAKCTDTGCFKEKTSQFVEIRRVDAGDDARKHDLPLPILRVSWKVTSVAPRMEKDGSGVVLAQTFKQGQWTEAKKKSCEHVRAAVAVDWSDSGDRGYSDPDDKPRKPGEIVQVCVEPKCKAHPKDYAKPKKSGSAGGARDEKAEAERRAREEADRIAESKIRVEIASRAIAGIKSLPGEVIRELALHALPNWEEALKPYRAVMPDVRKLLCTGKAEGVEFAKAVALASIGQTELTVRGGWSAKETRGKFIEAMKRIGYDASKAWEKPKAEKAAAPAQAKAAKAPAKKAAAKPAKKAAKKACRK